MELFSQPSLFSKQSTILKTTLCITPVYKTELSCGLSWG